MDLTFEQMCVACLNVGVDLSCGGCAELFYTGTRFAACDSGCRSLAHGVYLSRSEALMLAGAMRGAETRDGPLSEALPAIYKKLGGPAVEGATLASPPRGRLPQRR